MRRTGLYASCFLGKVHLVLRGEGGVLQDVPAYGARHQDSNASIRAFLPAVSLLRLGSQIGRHLSAWET